MTDGDIAERARRDVAVEGLDRTAKARRRLARVRKSIGWSAARLALAAREFGSGLDRCCARSIRRGGRAVLCREHAIIGREHAQQLSLFLASDFSEKVSERTVRAPQANVPEAIEVRKVEMERSVDH